MGSAQSRLRRPGIYGDRAGRIWLAYGFTDLQSQGDQAYGQMEIKESFASGSRVGPRYFSAGEPIDGERGYYGTDHGVTNEKELQLELDRAQALEYDNLKTYVRLPHELQLIAMKFAHEKLGNLDGFALWAAGLDLRDGRHDSRQRDIALGLFLHALVWRRRLTRISGRCSRPRANSSSPRPSPRPPYTPKIHKFSMIRG